MSAAARGIPAGNTGMPLLLCRVIAGVLRHAQEGELPLSVWTLGLPQPALIHMMSSCFPEAGALQPLPEPRYESIQQTLPDGFLPLHALLLQHASPQISLPYTDWMARAVAAGCLGERHLWQDLGLQDRAALGQLMADYFPSLFQRNAQKTPWKRFLFADIGVNGDTHLPRCGNCTDYALCFPDSKPPQD
jgi:nitrogen fixation protein NifQ